MSFSKLVHVYPQPQSKKALSGGRRKYVPGVCLANDRLLRPPPSGIFRRSFPLHSPRYARETIAESCSLRVALATAIISQTHS
jgi:hypothetical protein